MLCPSLAATQVEDLDVEPEFFVIPQWVIIDCYEIKIPIEMNMSSILGSSGLDMTTPEQFAIRAVPGWLDHVRPASCGCVMP